MPYTPETGRSVILIAINVSIQSTLFLVGNVFNIFILITLYRKSKISEDFFPFGCAVVDVLLLTVAFFRFTVPLIIDFIGASDIDPPVDSFGNALFMSVISIAVWTSVAIIGERYLTTIKPFKGTRQRWNHITGGRCKRAFIFIFVTCEIYNFPFFIEWMLLSSDPAKVNLFTYVYFLGIFPFLTFVIPFCIIICLNVLLSARTRPYVPRLTLGSSGGRMSMDQATGLMVTPRVVDRHSSSSTLAARLVSALVLLLVPLIVTHYIKYLGWELQSDGAEYLWVLKYTLLMLFSSVKFLIYRVTWKEFRQSFMQHVCPEDETCDVVSTSDEDSGHLSPLPDHML